MTPKRILPISWQVLLVQQLYTAFGVPRDKFAVHNVFNEKFQLKFQTAQQGGT